MQCCASCPVPVWCAARSGVVLCGVGQQCVQGGGGNVGWCAGGSERLGVCGKNTSFKFGSRSRIEKGSPQPWQALKKHEKMNVLLKDISWKMFVDILGFESSGRTVELKKTYL